MATFKMHFKPVSFIMSLELFKKRENRTKFWETESFNNDGIKVVRYRRNSQEV